MNRAFVRSFEERGRLGLSRVQHRLLTFSLPYLGKVLLGSRPRTLGEYQRVTVQITRLAWFPLGRLANFSYV